MAKKSVVITKKDKLKNSKTWDKLLKEGEEFQMRISHYLNDLGCLYDKYGLKGKGAEKETILSWEDRLKFTEEYEKVILGDFGSDLDLYLMDTYFISDDYDVAIWDFERERSPEGNVLQFKSR